MVLRLTLRCPLLFPHLLRTAFRWKQQINAGSVSLSHPDVAERFIAYNDIAAVAATALTSSQYDNKAVTIQGPAGISERQQLQVISKALGKAIAVVEVSEDEYKKNTPVPPPVVDSVHIVKRFRQEKGADWQAPTDATVTGSTTFEQFVASNKHEFTD